jgi:hypothetical protein
LAKDYEKLENIGLWKRTSIHTTTILIVSLNFKTKELDIIMLRKDSMRV